MILGTVQFGLDYGINNTSGKPTFKTVSDILDHAGDSGISLLDSAEAYGDAHDILGAYHQQGKHRFDIVTKFSAKRTDLPSSLKERISQNLKTLRVESLYAYLFHSFQDYKNYYQSFATQLADLKKQGLLRKIGVSVYTNSELEEVMQQPGIDLVQLPFNMLDNVAQRGDLLRRANEAGLEVHTRSAFLQGLFFIPTTNLQSQFAPIKPYLEQLHLIAKKSGIPLAHLAMAYCMRQKHIQGVLMGVDSLEQLKTNITGSLAGVPDDIIQEIDSIHVRDTALLNPSNWHS